jgi:hypothetical protein
MSPFNSDGRSASTDANRAELVVSADAAATLASGKFKPLSAAAAGELIVRWPYQRSDPVRRGGSMSRKRAILLAVVTGLCGLALGAGAACGIIAWSGPESLLASDYRRPSAFLANLSPQALIAKGSAAGGQWEWTEATGPAPSRCRTCMRNFVGHCKLDPRAGNTSFIVNDFQHKVWAAIEEAGGARLQSNDGRYHNGQTKMDLLRGDRPSRYREYQYACYQVDDAWGVAHTIGYREGEDLTVWLIVHEQ